MRLVLFFLLHSIRYDIGQETRESANAAGTHRTVPCPPCSQGEEPYVIQSRNMGTDQRIEALTKYIDSAKTVLELSSPQLNDKGSAEDYRLHLQQSFQIIGELGRANNAILKEHLFPVLEPDYILTDKDVDLLLNFSSQLADTTAMENIDSPLIYKQAEKMLEHAEKSGNLRALILALDNMIISAYMMINLTIRLYPDEDACFHYRDVGLKAAYRLLEFLEPDKFDSLPDKECKELVLINSRYIRCLFEWSDRADEDECNTSDIELLERSLALANDSFYREQVPGYNWDVHVFRTLQYLADFTEDNNSHRFNQAQLQEINGYTKRLIEYVKQHPELEGGCPKMEQSLYLARNSYLAGESSLEDYQDELLRIMSLRDVNDFSARSMFVMFTAPLEYIMTLDGNALNAQQEEQLRSIYDYVASYAYRMPKTGVLSFMLTFLSDILRSYMIVPGGMRFRDMALKIMAAMHPPTYIHTLNVADITRYLTGQLLEKEPDRFIGICCTKNAADVLSRKDDILDFAYNGALLHDIGKIFIVETIMTYGRNLIDSEFEIIQSHALVGASLLRRFPSLEDYAEMAIGHHKWFDDSRGYPESFSMKEAKYPALISLLTAADCLDAATDSVGRSYKGGITLEKYIDELREGSGTRYAPYVVELFEDPNIQRELEELLTEGRDKNYRNTYHLLKTL